MKYTTCLIILMFLYGCGSSNRSSNNENCHRCGYPEFDYHKLDKNRQTKIRGGMNPDVIRKTLLDNLSQFKNCYQKELDKAPKAFNGVVKLNFNIEPSGSVTKAGVDTISSKLPGKVRGCIVNVLKDLRFPRPKNGGIIEVSQPMNFYPRKRK